MKIATEFFALFIFLDYCNRGYSMFKTIKGGYFLDGEIWIGFWTNGYGIDLFQEEFSDESEARKFANGEKAVDINGQITF